MIKVQATVKLEISVSEGTWNPDVQMDQVYKQASQDAIAKIREKLGPGIKIDLASVTAVLVPIKPPVT